MQTNPFVLEGNQFWHSNFPLYVTREREFFSLPQHIHDFVEIQYVAEGRGFHYIDEKRIVVEKGDLFIIPIGTRHVYRPSSEAIKDELIVYNCLFASQVPGKLFNSYPLPKEIMTLLYGPSRAYSHFKDSFHEGRRLMESLHREFRSEQPGREAAMYALLTQLLVYLHRLEWHQVTALPVHAQFGSALAYIEEHFNRPLVVADIAKLIPASSSYTQRIFKRITGQSFTEYLQNVRMKKCTELLSQSSLAIKDVAERVGYRDLKFFYSLFRQKTGLTPHQYRIRSRGTSSFADKERE